MKGIVFACEMLRKIGIALPQCRGVAIGQPRKAGGVGAVVAGEATAGQGIAVGIADGFNRSRRAGKVALAAGIAPGSFGIPVPGFDRQLRILALGYWLPAPGAHLVQNSRY